MELKPLLIASLLVFAAPQTLSADRQKIGELSSSAKRIDASGDYTAVSTRDEVVLFDKDGGRKVFGAPGYIYDKFRISDGLIGIGTRETDSRFTIHDLDGGKLRTEILRMWVDNVATLETDGDTGFLVGSTPYLKLITKSETTTIRDEGFRSKKPAAGGFHADSDDHKEFLVATSRKNNRIDIRSYDTSGEKEWQISRESQTNSEIVWHNSTHALASWGETLALIRNRDGAQMWKHDTGSDFNAGKTQESFVYANSTHLTFLNRRGNIASAFRVNGRPDTFATDEDSGKVAIVSGERISVYTQEGRSQKIDLKSPVSRIDFYPDGDLAAAAGQEVLRTEIETKSIEPPELNSTVFVAEGKKAAKLAALGADVATGEEESSEVSKITGKNVSDSGGLQPNEAYATAETWTAESEREAAYLAALAEQKNASIKFETGGREGNSRDLEELKQEFIEEFNPNHVAVYSPDKWGVAALMAAKSHYYPVPAAETAGKTKDRVKEAFEKIGNNKNTVSEGRYVSLIGAPAFESNDPVDGLIEDPKDGDEFRNDIKYGNLDEDPYLEAAVGRYPEGSSSELYYRSLQRDRGGNATVASEYLHSSWPVILATAGGGLRTGKKAQKILEKEGYRTEHLSEHRAAPFKLLTDLVSAPGKLDKFSDATDKLGAYIGNQAAQSLKNAVMVVKALEYAQRTLEVYLEYDWHDYSFHFPEEGPDSASLAEVKEYFLGFLPERTGELNSSSLRSEVSSSDLVYYSGVGNSSAWRMPSEKHWTELRGKYSEKEFAPEDVPEVNNTLVFDSSTLGGRGNAEMRNAFIESGAAAYTGFSTVSYHSYASRVGLNYLRYGKTAGNAVKKGVNSLRSASFIYSPASSYKTGVREKMENSTVLYGNPETPKDPLPEESIERTKKCSDGRCRISIHLKPEPVRRNGVYDFNTSQSTMKPGMPILPLYTGNIDLPEGAEVLEVEKSQRFTEVDGEVPVFKPLTSSGNFKNTSFDASRFPEQSGVIETSGDSASIVQAAQRVRKGGLQNLEEASYTVSYRSPISVEIDRTNRTLQAEAWTEEPENLTIRYRAESENGSRDVSLSGEETYNLTELKPGVFDAEVVLFNREMKASDRETLKIAESPEINLEVSEPVLGGKGEVKASVRNPNSFAVSRNITAEFSGAISPGLFEQRRREVHMDPKEVRKLSWSALGTDTGSGEVRVVGKRQRVNVGRPQPAKISASEGKISLITSGKKMGVKADLGSGSRILNASTNRGRVVLRRSPERNLSKVFTHDYRSVFTSEATDISISIRGPSGVHIQHSNRVVERGKAPEDRHRRIKKESRRAISRAEELLSGLETEASR